MSSIVYGGLDVHKESITACVFNRETGEVVTERLANDRQQLLKATRRWSKLGELRLCYEAGSAGYVIQRWLTEAGFQCEVIAPSLVPKAPGDRVKTDKRDARKLATLYAAGLLQTVHVPTADEETVRALVRLYEQLTKDRTRVANRLIKYLRTLGHTYTAGGHWTQKHRDWLRALPLDELQELIVRTHLEELDAVIARRQEIARKIEEVAGREPYKERVGRLMCLRGIQMISAMVLVTALGDAHRFGKAPEVMSYFGLVPKEDSSGDTRRTGGITKAGNCHARWILSEAAWNQMSKPGNCQRLRKHWQTQPQAVVSIAKKAERRLHEKFWKIARRKDHRTAATAVAREMAGFVWALLLAEAP